MKVSMQLKAPDEAILTLQTEMTVAEAKRLRSTLNDGLQQAYDSTASEFVRHFIRAIERSTAAFDGAEIPE